MVVVKVSERHIHITLHAGRGRKTLGHSFVIMARKFAKPLYKSTAWQRCRSDYSKSVGGLCERCLAKGIYRPGVIVHHKVYLTEENIRDPEVALNFKNLELLCLDCHNEEHEKVRLRYQVDEFGRVMAWDD